MSWLRVLCVLLLGAVSARAWQTLEGDGRANAARSQVLERRPSEWPRAASGTWRDWSPDDEPLARAEPLLARALGAYRAGDLPAALGALFALLEELPDYPPALHQAGVLYFRLRRYGDASTAFERYLELAPRRVGDTRALGHCYYSLGEYEEALAHYARVLAVEPDSVEALRGKGLAQMRLGDSAAALETLARVLELDPAHADAQTWVARILYDEERVDEALVAARRARNLAPFEPRAWFLLGQIHYDLGQDEEGDAAYARFAELDPLVQRIRAAETRLLFDPRQPAVYDELIELNRSIGDDGRARHWLVRWIQSAPRDLELRLRALDLARDMHDVEGAAACAEALEVLARDSLEAWRRLAEYYAATEQRPEQRNAEEQVSRLRARRETDEE